MIVPARIDKDAAAAFIARLHRHHDPDQGARWWLGAWSTTLGRLVGVAVVGRPRSPFLDSLGRIAEVTRVCTDETKNACSFLYQRSAETAAANGYASIITYTLEKESGASLRALCWWPEPLNPNPNTTWANREGRKDGIRADIRWLKLLGEFYDCRTVEAPARQLEFA